MNLAKMLFVMQQIFYYLQKNKLNQNIVFSKHDVSNEKNYHMNDNFFDAIYTKSLIEHIDNHEFFFNECKRY